MVQIGSRTLTEKAAVVQVSDFGSGRGKYIADALRMLGLRVAVITNAPVYQTRGGTGNLLEGANPDKIITIPFGSLAYRSIPGRLLFYVSFTVLSFLELIKTKPKILYSRGPQPFTEIACLAYKALSRDSIIISDTTDLWPDSLAYVQMSPIIKSLMIRVGSLVMAAVYPGVDAVVTHNEVMEGVLKKRFGRPTFIIRGVIDLSRFGNPKAPDTLEGPGILQDKLNGKFVVLYAGLLGPFQNPRALLEIADRLDESSCIVVLGKRTFDQRLRKEAVRHGNLVFLGIRPFEEMPYYYSMADAFLLTYSNLDFLKIGLPKKFIEYAAAGRPILCVAPKCVAGTLCENWSAGYHVGPDDYEGAAIRLSRLREDSALRLELGKNARRMAEALFSVEGAAGMLSAILTDIGNQPGGDYLEVGAE